MYISFSKSLRLLLLNIYRKKIGLRALCSLRTFFKKISDFSCIIEKGVVMIHILVQYDWNVENNTILNVIGHKYTYLLTITKTKYENPIVNNYLTKWWPSLVFSIYGEFTTFQYLYMPTYTHLCFVLLWLMNSNCTTNLSS